MCRVDTANPSHYACVYPEGICAIRGEVASHLQVRVYI